MTETTRAGDSALPASERSAEVIETYVAQLREPDRARAASSLYRHLVLPESLRILRGDYRRIRLPTPTLLLFGAADSAFPPALANRVLQDHRTVPITWKSASSRVPRTSSPARGRMPWLITLSNSFPGTLLGSEFRSCGTLRLSLT